VSSEGSAGNHREVVGERGGGPRERRISKPTIAKEAVLTRKSSCRRKGKGNTDAKTWSRKKKKKTGRIRISSEVSRAKEEQTSGRGRTSRERESAQLRKKETALRALNAGGDKKLENSTTRALSTIN